MRQRKGSPTRPGPGENAAIDVGLLSDDEDSAGEQESIGQMTPGQWARQSRPKWATRSVDIVRGYLERFDPVNIGLRWVMIGLAVYSVYLFYCESCKEEYYQFALTLKVAIFDFLTGVQGSLSGAVVLALFVWLLTVFVLRRRSEVYLIDFQTYRHRESGGGEECTAGEFVKYERFLAEAAAAVKPDGTKCFNEQAIEFQKKILETSGISEKALLPRSMYKEVPGQDGVDAEKHCLTMKGAREETELMVFKAIEDLLKSTNTRPKEIGILIVNCSLFCPTPSLSSMIVNKFGMRSDILSFNLGGMGCSASPISIDLAKRLLRDPEQKGMLALVVSTENITQNWYRGNERSMLLQNTLFRCGAAAILLSNRNKDTSRARFRLLHTVRTHTGQSDECYKAVYQEEDAEGIKGVRLSKQIMQIAGDTLKGNISSLGPLVLPLWEQLKFFANMVMRRLIKGQVPLPGALRKQLQSVAMACVPLPGVRGLVGYKECSASASAGLQTPRSPAATMLRVSLPPYVPDFTAAFEWICVHTGGRAVIDAMEKNLALPEYYLEPSRLSLWKFGNTSSASIWYELQIIAELGNTCGVERVGGVLPPKGKERRLCKGDRIWQIAFGSGFKCNSAVWQCLKDH